MKEEFFIRLLNMSLTGGIVILAVLVLRLILRRAPKVFSYCMWAVVLFRLLCPVSFSLPVSVFEMLGGRTAEQGMVYYIPEDIAQREQLQVNPPLPDGGSGNINEAQFQGSRNTEGNSSESPVMLVMMAWSAGVCGLLLHGVFSLLAFRRRLNGAEWTGNLSDNGLIKIPVYEKEGLGTSFVMGIFRPGIYLPGGLSEEERKYILLHEQIHIRRFDHIIRLVSFLALCIHWFNPLVWVAFFLSGRDMEMSCDEAVIRRLGSSIKREYSASLLNFATGKRIIGGVPLAFGEGDTGSRIRNVLKYHKPRIAAVCVAGIIVALAAVFLLANPMKKQEEVFLPENSQEQEGGEGQPEGGRADDGGNQPEGGQTDSGENLPESEQQQDAEKLREAMRSISWEEEFTWKRLKDMVEEQNTNLQDYAGYDGAEWDDSDGSVALNRYLIYRMTDKGTGQVYRLMISYLTADNPENQINMLYLLRESDQSILSLYQGESYGGWQDADIDGFIGYIPKLSDWIAEYRFPGEEYLAADDFSAVVGDYGGQAFQYIGKYIDVTPPGEWVPTEWAAAVTLARADGERFVFVDGMLADVFSIGNHCERVTEVETVDGCEEQTVLFLMNCDRFTIPELEEAEAAGTPVPESERTVDVWYVCVGKEGAPYGYVATLSRFYFTKEDAVSFAQSLKFTEEAWEENI